VKTKNPAGIGGAFSSVMWICNRIIFVPAAVV
jgi:hypothetical protein